MASLCLFLFCSLKSQNTQPKIELAAFECGNLKFRETQAYDGFFDKKYWIGITGVGKELTKWDKLEEVLHFTTFNGSGEFWTQYEVAGEIVASSNKIPVAQYCGIGSCEDMPTLLDSLRALHITLLKAEQEITQLQSDLYSGTIFSIDCASNNEEKTKTIDSLQLALSKADSIINHYKNQPTIETVIQEIPKDTCLSWSPEFKDKEVSFELYPNPVATDKAFTLLIKGEGDYKINIYNEIGSQVPFKYKGVALNGINLTEGTHQFSINGVGVYLLSIDNEELIVTKKIIVIDNK